MNKFIIETSEILVKIAQRDTARRNHKRL